MKIPRKNFTMRVGPYAYSVEWDSSLKREDLRGEHQATKRIIRLYPDTTVAEANETLVHELLHAAVDVSGLVFMFGRDDYKPTEEDVVRQISTVFYQIVYDNPRIFTQT